LSKTPAADGATGTKRFAASASPRQRVSTFISPRSYPKTNPMTTNPMTTSPTMTKSTPMTTKSKTSS
jgi:hypothetical protein